MTIRPLLAHSCSWASTRPLYANSRRRNQAHERSQALDHAYQNACDKAATLRNMPTEMREILIHVPHYTLGSGMLYAAPWMKS